MKGPVLFQEALTKFKNKIFSRTHEPISINPDTKHPWMKEITFPLSEGSHPFQGDIIAKKKKYNNEIKKKNSSPEQLANFHEPWYKASLGGPMSPKLITKHLWVKGNYVCSDEGSCPFPSGDYNKKAKIH